MTLPVTNPQLTATGTKSAAGDNTLIAAPGAGKQIVISALILQNESATATTLIVKAGATAVMRCLAQNQGDGLALAPCAGARTATRRERRADPQPVGRERVRLQRDLSRGRGGQLGARDRESGIGNRELQWVISADS